LIRHAIDVCIADETPSRLPAIHRELNAATHVVRADPARFQQVIWNLLKNAIKFTPPGGRIEVRTENDAASRLLVHVTDTGPGIDPEMLPKIFDALEQGEGGTGGELGLGLTIAKELVVGHGGEIHVHSAGKGAGATFSVELPTVDAPATAIAPSAQPRAPGLQKPPQHQRARILL